MTVQPDTLLRRGREVFRLVWKRKAKATSHTPDTPAETIALIMEMGGIISHGAFVARE